MKRISRARPTSPLQSRPRLFLPYRPTRSLSFRCGTLLCFPGHVVPITIGRERSVAAAQQAVRDQLQIGLLMQRNPDVADPASIDMHRVGAIANIVRYVTAPDGSHHLVCHGDQRFQVIEFLDGWPFPVARVSRIAEPDTHSAEIEARFLHLKSQTTEALRLLPQVRPRNCRRRSSRSPRRRGSPISRRPIWISSPEEKQEILETVDIAARMEKVSRILGHHIEVLRMSREIGRQTKAALDERQREVLLREQMAAIQRQLGEGEAGKAEEITELEARRSPRRRCRRRSRSRPARSCAGCSGISEAAPEYGMARSYLDWLIELPWDLPEETPIDIAEARRVLDQDHYGLEKIKRRIIEYLAVRKLAPHGKAPILCFVGPPGVGKTSLGQSIARAMNRKFVRVSLGGVHDEAEIRGHRRTYIGALPGNIIQAIRKAESRNCVMMLDEIDKLAGVHGDPGAALLEVLDPEQNNTFRDNYLGAPFDLSRVVFITTANVLDAVPGPLRDRMEIIPLSGYTADEKFHIAHRYLVSRQIEANGVQPGQVEITDEALREIIKHYTREAGVRGLEREIGKTIRHAAVRIAEGQSGSVRIASGDLAAILGPPRFESELAMRMSMPGVATGLAWTPVGGDILFIEATRNAGHGKLILTGQLGEVMRESAQAALSIVEN